MSKKNDKTNKTNNVENPNALKLLIDAELLHALALGLSDLKINEFEIKAFKSLKHELHKLELKDRIQLVSKKLYEILGEKKLADYLDIYLKDRRYEKGIASLQWWPISDLVEIYTLKKRTDSFQYLLWLTEIFTSEFAVRSILNKETELVLEFLLKASKSKNFHHRRFASEGSRPLLPWGKKAISIAKDPSLTEGILNNLKYDEELYVRKSVANHLNDFSKSHPDFVLKILKSWNKNIPKEHLEKIEWITKHALRSLIKKGNAEALELVNGKLTKKIKVSNFSISKKKIKVGDKLHFAVELFNPTAGDERFVLEYIIGFKLKTGKLGYKTFKGTAGVVHGKEKFHWAKSHSFKVITTRVFQSGIHEIKLLINGQESEPIKFNLIL